METVSGLYKSKKLIRDRSLKNFFKFCINSKYLYKICLLVTIRQSHISGFALCLYYNTNVGHVKRFIYIQLRLRDLMLLFRGTIITIGKVTKFKNYEMIYFVAAFRNPVKKVDIFFCWVLCMLKPPQTYLLDGFMWTTRHILHCFT